MKVTCTACKGQKVLQIAQQSRLCPACSGQGQVQPFGGTHVPLELKTFSPKPRALSAR